MNSTADGTVHFIHIGDSHLRDGADDDHLARLIAMRDEIERLHAASVPIDFVAHTGDLADAADEAGATPDATRKGLDVLGALGVPWYLLGGNHDRRAFLVAGKAPVGAVASAAHPSAADAGRSVPPHADDLPALLEQGVCRRVHGALECLFLNADPEDGERDLHGAIAPSQVDAVANRLDALPAGGRAALFLHYPPLPQEAAWTGSPSGGEALHAALVPRAARVAGVFAGHVHRGVSHLVDGLLHVSVPALSRGFMLWPGADHAFDDLPTVAWHYVSVGPGGTRVQSHAFVPGRGGDGIG